MLSSRLRMILVALMSGFAASATSAQEAGVYTIDPRHSAPWFEVDHFGYSIQRGRFTRLSGKIVLDPQARKGSVELVIDAASIDMGFEEWNKHMRGEDYFNVAKHPTIRFTSDKVIFSGDTPVAAEGFFTLLGVTRPMRLEVTRFHCAPHPFVKKPACGGDVTATIRRSDFGMTRLVPKIGDEVRLFSPVEAVKTDD